MKKKKLGILKLKFSVFTETELGKNLPFQKPTPCEYGSFYDSFHFRMIGFVSFCVKIYPRFVDTHIHIPVQKHRHVPVQVPVERPVEVNVIETTEKARVG